MAFITHLNILTNINMHKSIMFYLWPVYWRACFLRISMQNLPRGLLSSFYVFIAIHLFTS